MGSSTEGPGRGKGGMFFWGGSTLLEESSPTKYKGGAIQDWLKINRQWRGRGREGGGGWGGGHEWGHKYYVNQPKYFNPNTLLPLVDK